MKNEFQAYNINEKYELKTYHYVGKDYGNRKTANRGWILNIRRWFRRKINKKENKYKFCDTYLEWKNHIKEVFPVQNSCEKENFVHWLEQKRRYAKGELEAVKIILIPLYIALLSIDDFFMKKNLEINSTGKFGPLVVVLVISLVYLENARLKKEFYEDLLDITEEK